MAHFNMDDYAPVEERIGLFYEAHPTGRIFTTIERLDPPLVVFRAEVYREAGDALPWATGYAYEKEGEGHVNRTSYIENCETSAIGRALANAGYHGRRDGAPRPSREEMQKVERMGGTPAKPTPEQRMYQNPAKPPSEPVGVKHSNAPDFLDTKAIGKKANGKTWRELMADADGRGYVRWCIKNMDRLGFEEKEILTVTLAAAELGDPDFSKDLGVSEPLPF